MFKTDNRSYFYAIGRRKTSRATVKLFPEGEGNIYINGKPVREWSDTEEIYKTVLAPLNLLSVRKDFDVVIRVSGGGKRAQGDSARLGISRALIRKDGLFRLQLKEAGFITRDARVKERKKPGLKKARRASQFSKR
jgi:small subunit ribosomal protein S9